MTDKNIDKFTRTAWEGNIEKIEEFIKNGIDVNSNNPQQVGMTALMRASKYGHKDVVKFLVDSGALVNIKDKYDKTALICATDKGNTEIVEYLISNGAK